MTGPGRAHVSFVPDGPSVDVPVGTVLLAAALEAGVAVAASCGGRGTCGACRVRVRGGVSGVTSDEAAQLLPGPLADGVRLACRVRVLGDVAVEAAPPAAGEVAAVTSSVARAAYDPDRVAAGDAAGAPVGIAYDIGTTTLAAALVDLRSGDTLAVASADNPQAAFGADVLSRVSAAREHLAEMHAVVVGALDRLTAGLTAGAGIDDSDVADACAVGNPAMVHLLLSIDPSPLEHAPWSGVMLDAVDARAADADLSLPSSPLYVPPGVSAFVGADVTAGLVATGLAGLPGTAAYLDMGTNGEIVLKSAEGLRAASSAAGPAFEGSATECGVRAVPGAIESVSLDRTGLRLKTVDDAEPCGVCGSGMVDLVALLLDEGVLDGDGLLRAGTPGPLGGRVSDRGDQLVFAIDEDESIVLTQKDVREVQLAKAAVRAALDLLAPEGEGEGPPDTVLVAGGFGRALSATSLERIGAVPRGWAPRVTFVGNAALEGARALLVSDAARAEAARIASEVRTVQLATDPAFQEAYLSALAFPAS